MAYAIGVPYGNGNGRGSGRGVVLVASGENEDEEPPDIFVSGCKRTIAVNAGTMAISKSRTLADFFYDHHILDYINQTTNKKGESIYEGNCPLIVQESRDYGRHILVGDITKQNEIFLYLGDLATGAISRVSPYLITPKKSRRLRHSPISSQDEAREYAFNRLEKELSGPLGRYKVSLGILDERTEVSTVYPGNK